jgi:hypothetical protein
MIFLVVNDSGKAEVLGEVEVSGKVAQEESDKDITQTKYKVVNKRIFIAPLFFDSQQLLDDPTGL